MEIQAESEKENGIIEKSRTVATKTAGVNDFYTITSGVGWFRKSETFQIENALIENRKKFLTSKDAEPILNEVASLMNVKAPGQN